MLGDMEYLSSFKKYLHCFMQYFQACIFFVAHYYISVAITLIFVFAGQNNNGGFIGNIITLNPGLLTC